VHRCVYVYAGWCRVVSRQQCCSQKLSISIDYMSKKDSPRHPPKYRAMQFVMSAEDMQVLGSPCIRDALRARATELVRKEPRKLKALAMYDMPNGGIKVFVLLLNDKETAKQSVSWFNNELGRHMTPPLPRERWQVPDAEYRDTQKGVDASLKRFRDLYKTTHAGYEEIPQEDMPISSTVSSETNYVLNRFTDERPMEELLRIPMDELIDVFASVDPEGAWILEMQDFRERVIGRIAQRAELSGSLKASFEKVMTGLDELLASPDDLRAALGPADAQSFRTACGASSGQSNPRLAWEAVLTRVRREVRQNLPKLGLTCEDCSDASHGKRHHEEMMADAQPGDSASRDEDAQRFRSCW